MKGKRGRGPGGFGGEGHPLLMPDQPLMRDAATGTPTHFVEKRIDPSYDWNEWSLRRKALQMANLRNARTVSSQTDASHFRRENETQVWLPRQKGTNTGVERGTNPPRSKNYLTGLRGDKATKFAKPDERKDDEHGSHQAKVVNLTFEL